MVLFGSTRIPKIQKLLQEYFDGKKLNKTINPDEAVAYGAAVQAAILYGHAEKTEILLKDITPLSLGIGTGWGSQIMDIIVNRNTELPASRTSTRLPLSNYQTYFHFHVYQGESFLVKDNFKLGEFIISGIPPAVVGAESVNITFSIDLNGILKVSAVLNSNLNVTAGITIQNSCGHHTTGAIHQMIRDSEIYCRNDNKMREFQAAKQSLEEFCYETKDKIDRNAKIYEDMTKTILDKCNDALDLLSKETTLNNQKNYYEKCVSRFSY